MPHEAEGKGWSDPLRDRIERIANHVRALHHAERRGDLASLRRMDAYDPVEPAFQRILVRVAPDAERREASRLALFVKILALAMAPDVLTTGTRTLGSVMRETGVSERRVQTLMTAQGSIFDDQILRLARRLVRSGSLPYVDMGRLILGDASRREKTRFDVAKGFWTADARLASITESTPAGDL